MEFEGQYLTYQEYKSLGGSLDLMPFNLLEFEARKQIDKRTQYRLKNVNEAPEEVKICIFNLIGKIKKYNETSEKSNTDVASESIDGYSVTFINPSQIKEIVKSKETELTSIIDNDLFGVIVNDEHILYNGVKYGC